jgi:murein DD-endopeptidase MepM/ murein hydrolase activator NlpD
LFRRYFITAGIVVVLLIALFLSFQVFAQSRSPFPIDITAGPAPQSFIVDGRARLSYELRFTNFAPFKIDLTSIDVLGDSETPLATYRADALEKMVVPAERVVIWADPPKGAPPAREIVEGHTAVIFFDVALDPGAHAPAKLRHRFSFSFAGNDGAAVQRSVDSAAVPVIQQPATVLRAALRGASWIAFNAFSNGNSSDHRRAFNAVDGRIYDAQRFAIDWAGLGPDGRLFHGDSKSNANFYGYGAEVIAVADGRISDLNDRFPDNVGSNDRAKRIITLDNALGNSVTIDIGNGRFAIYGHLQPGSLKVKLGETVKAGQVLARLGNSGNSDGPHLHFQLTDANSPLASEGIPYEIESFTQLDVLKNSLVLDDGSAWQPKSDVKPVVRRREFPVDNAVVTFP